MREQLEEIQTQDLNPIDHVEAVLSANNWVFNRAGHDELVVEIAGKNTQYTLFFIWQDEMNALQFGCHCDTVIAAEHMEKACLALASINENLWMGHFDLPAETQTPIFRYTALLHGGETAAITGVIENLVDIALIQCERHSSVFQLLSQSSQSLDAQTMELASMDVLGES